MSAELAFQKALASRLNGSAKIAALMPVANILDRHSRPAPTPSIIMGEDQVIEGGDIARAKLRIFSTLHIWTKEPGMRLNKAIAGAIRETINAPNFGAADGWHFADVRVSSTRFLRDPDGKTAHGVVTIETLMGRIA